MDLVNESLPFDGWLLESRVEEGVVRNVLLCGNLSLNGRKIPPSAFGSESEAKALYEGKSVFVDHDRENPTSRSVGSLAGHISNVRLTNGKPYGDIVTKGAPQGPLLFALAEARHPNVGMSHVAAYQFSDQTCEEVAKVQSVYSVDAVCEPATTKSFFEHTYNTQHERDGSMAELNTFLQGRVDQLEQENAQLKVKIAEQESAATKLQETATGFESRVAELKAQLEAEQAKTQEFDRQAAAHARETAVRQELESAGLDVSDKDKVSDLFVESLLAVDDAEKRQKLIEDRVKLVGKAPAKSGNSTHSESDTSRSTQRKQTPPEQWSVESALGEVKFI